MKKLKIVVNEEGNKIVIIPDIIFNNKQSIDWTEVERYLSIYVGDIVEIAETKDIICIGNELPDEYSNSKYTRMLKGARAKAKANAVQGLREMIEISENKMFSENRKEKHIGKAGKGWYYYATRFAVPLYFNQKKTKDYSVYSACLVINHASNGNKYLYDLIDIKKEASNPLRIIE